MELGAHSIHDHIDQMNKPEAINSRIKLLGMSQNEMERLSVLLGEKPYRGRQLYRWIYHRREIDFERMNNLNLAFRNRLKEQAVIDSFHPSDEFTDDDDSRKYLFRLPDGERIESVYIPEGLRHTVCLSTQVGCTVGCGFCATGRIGFKRNLRSGEIIGQFLAIERALESGITNIVMMGMGEPLLNRHHLFSAIRLLVDNDGIGFSHKKITVSTSGWVPGITAMTKAHLKAKLAISLNATTEQQRRKLMPRASRWSIPELMDAARKYSRSSGSHVSIGYLLMNGENDSDQDARRLVGIASQLGAKVNLMEYNEVSSLFKSCDPERRDKFYGILKNSNITVTLRTSRGKGVAGACGQLAGGYKVINQ